MTLPRILFLCTKNSARSQIAEALVVDLARGAITVASAGAEPGMEVDPLTFEVLDELGIDWREHRPKGFEATMRERWDVVITLCDAAREACPILPGQPAFAHWPIDDPVREPGPRNVRREAFVRVVHRLQRPVMELLDLPLDSLDRASLERRLGAIGQQAETTSAGSDLIDRS